MPRPPGSLSKIRTLARKLAKEEEAQQAQRRQARALAQRGRGGDSEIAHVTPGEIIVPRELQTPEVMAALDWAAAGAGLSMDRLRVGARGNSINPSTGAPEFDISDLYKKWNVDPPKRLPPIMPTTQLEEILVRGPRITPPAPRIAMPNQPLVPIASRGNEDGRGLINERGNLTLPTYDMCDHLPEGATSEWDFCKGNRVKPVEIQVLPSIPAADELKAMTIEQLKSGKQEADRNRMLASGGGIVLSEVARRGPRWLKPFGYGANLLADRYDAIGDAYNRAIQSRSGG